MTAPAPELRAYDSTRPDLVPADAWGIMPYADGKFAWSKADVARFPRARRRHITVFGDAEIADIADVERGDVRPQDAPDFIRERYRLFPRARPTIYCNRSTLPAVQDACGGLVYYIWLATLDGSKLTFITGGGRLVAVQFEGGPHADFDVSVVLDHGWLRPPPP